MSLIELNGSAADASAPTVEARAREVARVAAEHADAVDREARFPEEAVAALRDAGLLHAGAPVELGGEGLSLTVLALVAAILGAACASTAMIFAMHVSQLLSVTRHADDSPATRKLARRIVRDRLLLASATTEIGTGGDLGRSVCHIEPIGTSVHLAKQAPVISYGEYADMILVTARRDLDAPGADQVLVAVGRADMRLTPTSEWDTLGLRGTCSRGFQLEALVDPGNVIPVPYEQIATESVVPTSHVLWAGVWLGMARSAVEKAHGFVRAAARKSIGTTPAGATALVGLVAQRDALASLVAEHAGLVDALDAAGDRAAFGSVGTRARLGMLKVSASEALRDIAAGALNITGIAGFTNAGPFSVARLFRDAQGAAVMVHNDRITAQTAQLLLVQKGM